MSGIKPGVFAAYLNQYPSHIPVVRAFADLFEVSHGERWIHGTSNVGAFLLKPSQKISEFFGFTRDLIMVYAPYNQIQARTVQAASAFAQRDNIRTRAERLCIILVSDDPKCEVWVRDYLASNPESQIIIPFSSAEIVNRVNSSDLILSTLESRLHQIDFFDESLPLKRDTFFFGRSDALIDLLAGLRGQMNRGLFGLRKVGKTSLLYKLEREFKRGGEGSALFLNCADPALGQCDAGQLLDRISEQLAQLHAIPRKDFVSLTHPSDRFRETCRRVSKGRPLALLFDEIEHISFLSKQYPHWQKEFLIFWQAVRAAQQAIPTVSVIICGVNASVCERPHIEGSPNPLFGIIKPVYLQGLSKEDTADMLRQIGSPMRVVFEPAALEQLHTEYGGHPLLTRLACSFMYQRLKAQKSTRPLTITTKNANLLRAERDQQIQFYCQYITADIKEFYPDEFDLLENVSSGDIVDFIDFYADEAMIRHLIDYGLIQIGPPPLVKIEVLSEYLRWQKARRLRRRLARDLVAADKRENWYHDRLRLILGELRKLGKIAQNDPDLRALLRKEPFANQEMLFDCGPPNTKNDFLVLMNRLYQVFIESQPIKATNLFFQKANLHLPYYQRALHRVRVYRNWEHHLELNGEVQEQVSKFLLDDLEGNEPERVPGVYFALAQIAVDELALATITENSSRS